MAGRIGFAAVILLALNAITYVIEDPRGLSPLDCGQDLTLLPNLVIAVEGSSAIFSCSQPLGVTITLQVRAPGENTFRSPNAGKVTTSDSQSRSDFTYLDAERMENGTELQCGGAGLSSNIGILLVYYPPEYANPGPQTVRKGQTFQINITLAAYPIPSVGNFLWEKDAENITAVNDVGVDFIRFLQVDRGDAGSYTVKSTNLAGSGNTSFELFVQYPPEFEADTGSITCISSPGETRTCAIQTGDNGTLGCFATGSPPPVLSFSVATSNNSNIDFNSSTGDITVDAAVSQNAGIYTCNATNDVDVVQRVYRVYIGGVPSIDKLQVIEDHDSVDLMWELNNNGVPTQKYVINITCETQNVFHKQILHDQQGNRIVFRVALSLLQFNSSCTASVQASNLLGYSVAAETTFSTPASTLVPTTPTTSTTSPTTTTAEGSTGSPSGTMFMTSPTSGVAPIGLNIFEVCTALLLMMSTLYF